MPFECTQSATTGRRKIPGDVVESFAAFGSKPHLTVGVSSVTEDMRRFTTEGEELRKNICARFEDSDTDVDMSWNLCVIHSQSAQRENSLLM